MGDHKRRRRHRFGVGGAACVLAALAILAIPALGWPTASDESDRRTYASPEEAVAALVAAVRANDRAAFSLIFPSGLEEIATNDDVQDDLVLMAFSRRLLTRYEIVKTDETTAVLYIGLEDVLFPVPIRKGAGGWYFDVERGRERILDARIGQNERGAVELLRLFVTAQKQYAAEDRDGDGVLEYAGRILSTPGTMDGLYWPNNDMAPESPFGPIVSLARAQGYRERGTREQPYQGYFFRILVRQGAFAPGGRKEYVDQNGDMTGGFGCVAYPARWGVSGIMTFVVGPDGRVFARNLGTSTGMVASAITEFNPDETWLEVRP